jgi:hypothetical protein
VAVEPAGVRTLGAAVATACWLAVPAHAGDRCDTRQVETLTVALPSSPSGVRPGATLTVPIEVSRAAGTPAAEVEVFVALTGSRWGAYDIVRTNVEGSGTARLPVPRDASGKASLAVEAVREVVILPCLRLEEHGESRQSWGTVR